MVVIGNMATMKRLRPDSFKILAKNLKELDGKVGRAGWFETSKYEDGTPVAAIAAVHEMGATINHPGGTPFFTTSDGSAHFVHKNTAFSFGLPETKPHQIIIPPRPFMRPTMAREKQAWLQIMGDGAKKVFLGTVSAKQVMEAVALRAAGDIAKTIAQLTSPPLKPSTIAARKRKMSDKKTVGSLTKPLVASGLLIQSVTGKAEDA